MCRSYRIALLLSVVAARLLTAETSLESRITSVGLFKNGLAVVKRTLAIPGDGVYAVQDVPVPVHGTLWIESDATVETRVTTREVEGPLCSSEAPDFQADLVGREVTIHFRDGAIPPATGTVMRVNRAEGEEAWNRRYERDSHYGWWYYRRTASRSNQPSSRFLILQTPTGRVYVAASMIAYLSAKEAGNSVKRRQPVLLFTASGVRDKPATITVTYLTKGMAWAPSYCVDISHPKDLSLKQKAIIKNELEDIAGAEVLYIGGNDSRKTTVVGELTASNHRKEAVSLVIRRRFSGELLKADGSPTCVLREEGVYSVNKRNELTWALALEPGEHETLTYRYTVLVDN